MRDFAAASSIIFIGLIIAVFALRVGLDRDLL